MAANPGMSMSEEEMAGGQQDVFSDFDEDEANVIAVGLKEQHFSDSDCAEIKNEAVPDTGDQADDAKSQDEHPENISWSKISTVETGIKALHWIKDDAHALGFEIENCSAFEGAISMMENKDDLLNVTESLKTMRSALGKFTGGNPDEILSGSGEIISAVCSLLPLAGQVLDFAFPLCSTVFCLFGIREKKSMSDVIENIMIDALKFQKDEMIKSASVGVRDLFATSHAFLVGMTGKVLSKHETQCMLTQVKVYKGVKFLGELGSAIDACSKIERSTKKFQESIERTFDYLELYCKLALLRDGILYQMLALLKMAKHSQNIANAVECVIDSSTKTNRRVLEFLVDPRADQVAVVSSFNASEERHLLLVSLMRRLGLELPNLSYLTACARTLTLPAASNMRAYMSSMPINSGHILLCNKDAGGKDLFCFKAVGNDNHFEIVSNKWPDYFVYMPNLPLETTDLRGRTHKTGPKATWKIVRLRKGGEKESTDQDQEKEDKFVYVMSTRKWPTAFACGHLTSAVHIAKMASVSGNVGHCNLIPTEMAQWEIA